MSRIVLVFMTLMAILSVAFGVSGNWTAVAMDSTGRYLTASSDVSGAYPGHIFTSDDYGSTWVSKAPAFPWMGVASDSTGKKLVAVGQCYPGGSCGAPYESTDRGDTWISPSAADHKDNYYTAGSDATGTNLLSTTSGNAYMSTNGGTSWFRFNLDEGYCGTAGAISGDGKTVIIDYMEYIYGTMNNGYAWTKFNTPTARWRMMTSDSAGKVLAGAYDLRYGSGGNYESAFWVSTDAGATWSAILMTIEGEKYYSVSANGNGNYVFCGGSGGIYVYDVAAKTVTKSNAPAYGYYSIASSQNGQYVLASSSQLWFSSDFGKTFKVVD